MLCAADFSRTAHPVLPGGFTTQASCHEIPDALFQETGELVSWWLEIPAFTPKRESFKDLTPAWSPGETFNSLSVKHSIFLDFEFPLC
jgi:hypothetical protein